MRLNDKVAIVTGSTSGIGKATAQRFVAEGAKVTVVGRNVDAGRQLEVGLNQRMGDAEGGALFVEADISKAEDVRRLVDATVERWGRVDVLVNNAAVMTFDRIANLEESDWDKVLGVNLKGAFLSTKYCIPYMRPGAAVVNVLSVHGAATAPTVVSCAASKGGLEAFTRGLAVELHRQGIRVNALRPGAWRHPCFGTTRT